MRRCPRCGASYDQEAVHCPVDGTLLLSPDELGKHAGATLDDRYYLEQRIGAGGLGEVYRARHLKMGRTFAVKLLHPRMLTDPQFVVRFDREARALSRLRHPCCIEVTDYGHSDLGPYIVMELLAGEPLSRHTRGPGLPLGQVLELTRDVLSGLEHAHEQGIIHRDLKPDNVMLVPQQLRPGALMPKILDFGVAKIGRDASREGAALTAVGLVLGTPSYMAPEQLSAGTQVVDARADLYAVGVILYELCCGRRPYSGHDALSMIRAHLTETPTPTAELRPSLPPGLAAIIERALQSRPADRFASAAAFRQALTDLPPLSIEQATERPPPSSAVATAPTAVAVSQPCAAVDSAALSERVDHPDPPGAMSTGGDGTGDDSAVSQPASDARGDSAVAESDGAADGDRPQGRRPTAATAAMPLRGKRGVQAVPSAADAIVELPSSAAVAIGEASPPAAASGVTAVPPTQVATAGTTGPPRPRRRRLRRSTAILLAAVAGAVLAASAMVVVLVVRDGGDENPDRRRGAPSRSRVSPLRTRDHAAQPRRSRRRPASTERVQHRGADAPLPDASDRPHASAAAPGSDESAADASSVRRTGRWSPPEALRQASRMWRNPRSRSAAARRFMAYLNRHRDDAQAHLYVARHYLQSWWGADGLKLVLRAEKADPRLKLDPTTLVSLCFAYQQRTQRQARRVVDRHGGKHKLRVLLVGAAAIRDQQVQRNLLAHVRQAGGPRSALDSRLQELAAEFTASCARRRQLLAGIRWAANDPLIKTLLRLLSSDRCLGARARELLRSKPRQG